MQNPIIVSNVGNTAGNTGLTYGTVVLSGSNITLSQASASNGIITIGITGPTAISNINVSAGTTSNNLSAVVFSNSNRVSFGLNGSTVTAQHALNFSAGTTSNNISDQLIFSNSNRVSFGINGSTVTAQHALNFSAGTTSNNVSDQLIFSNANNVSFGLDASTITASVNAGGVTLSNFCPFVNIGNGAGFSSTSHAPASFYFCPITLPAAVAMSNIIVIKTISISPPTATSQNSSGTILNSYSQGVTLFKRSDFGANSSIMTTVASASFGLTAGFTFSSSSQSMNYSWVTNTTGGTTSFSTTSGSDGWTTLFNEKRIHAIPFVTTLTAGEYFIGFGQSTTTAITGSNVTLVSFYNFGPPYVLGANGWHTFGANSNAVASYFFGGEGFGRASALTTNATMALSVISTVAEAFPYMQFINASSF